MVLNILREQNFSIRDDWNFRWEVSFVISFQHKQQNIQQEKKQDIFNINYLLSCIATHSLSEALQVSSDYSAVAFQWATTSLYKR